jgi:4-amino-4-deoxy-L-arabinose transferase-like glycosyltransferase
VVSQLRSLVRRPSPIVWAVLVLALALRIGVVAATWHYKPVNDPFDYDRIGYSIAQGHGYPHALMPPYGRSAFRPPGYPYYLGAVYAATGGRVHPARLSQALLGAIMVALIGLLGWRLWGRRVGVVALTVAAVFPPLILIDTALLSESLFLPLELGAVLAALEYWRAPQKHRWVVLAGVLVGLASLTRPVGLLLLIPVGSLVLVRRTGRRSSPFGPAVLALAAVVTIAPWTIRNALVLHAFVPISTDDGFTLAATYNDRSRTDTKEPAAWRAGLDAHDNRLVRQAKSEVRLNDELRAAALDEISDHPSYVLKVAAYNVPRLLELSGPGWSRRSATTVGLPAWMADLGRYSFWLLLPFALIGALLPSARRPPKAFWAVAVMMSLGGIFVEAFVRLRAPVDPFLVLLCSLTIVAGWESSLPSRWHESRRANRRRSRATIATLATRFDL